MSRLLSRLFFSLVGYFYLRVRYGKHHKRKLIKDFGSEYYYAGLTVVWLPPLVLFVMVLGLALVYLCFSVLIEV